MNHVYRTYANLGVTVCQNCAKFQTDIEKIEHHLYEHGYCDPDCQRCKADICTPPQVSLIKPV